MTDRAAWKVDYTMPATDQKRWTSNHHATVVAGSLERVVDLIKEQHPECTLIAVHRVGSEREIIVDSE